jgi:hypothetical protein
MCGRTAAARLAVGNLPSHERKVPAVPERPIIVFDLSETRRRLRDHGFRLFTLTGNTLEISGRQLEAAG